MMRYFLVVLFAGLTLTASAQDERYYKLHPKALQQAIKECSIKKQSSLSCDNLLSIAVYVNEMAQQLQSNPQAFGQSILELQETIARQEQQLFQHTNQSEIKSALDENKKQLAERLALVNLLESPES